MLPKEKIDIVIPVYNEEACIDELVHRMVSVVEKLSLFKVSIIFVNDGSDDKSMEKLKHYADRYDYFKIICLSRNFGHQLAITAGLDHSYADFAVIMDGDLQDPPELITELVSKSKEGYDIVYAQRKVREGESHFKRFTAGLFYRLINVLCQLEIPPDTGDFRLINKKVLTALKQMRERHRFIRGMIPWLGFKSAPVYYDRDQRYAGETKYKFRRMFNFAMDAVFSFSNVPLRIANYLGLVTVAGGLTIGAVLVFLRLFTHYTIPGITAVILIIIIMSGIQIFMIGLVGEYIGRIFEEIKGRKLYIVDSRVNFSPPWTKNEKHTYRRRMLP